MKTVLGVQKSCDASIVMPLKNAIVGMLSSDEKISSHKHSPDLGASGDLNRTSSTNETVNLETAIQSKLSAERAKPRSRSLIWRPSRRRSKTTAESSDCQVS